MTEPLAVPPSPEQAAAQLAIHRYAVTAADQATHDRLAAEAPWATWAEPRDTLAPAVSWLVTVFAVDNDRFLTIIARHEDNVAIRTLGEQWETGDSDPELAIWGAWHTAFPPQSSNGHGHG